MFSHFDRRGKCEWFEGGLHAFVSHYNSERGTAYSLTVCLDILSIGPATPNSLLKNLVFKAFGSEISDCCCVVKNFFGPFYQLSGAGSKFRVMFSPSGFAIGRGCKRPR